MARLLSKPEQHTEEMGRWPLSGGGKKTGRVLKPGTMNNVGILNGFTQEPGVWCAETTEEREREIDRQREK